jgi:hypothetical protein
MKGFEAEWWDPEAPNTSPFRRYPALLDRRGMQALQMHGADGAVAQRERGETLAQPPQFGYT